MKPSLLSRLLFCLFFCGTVFSGTARADSIAERDPLMKLRKEGWKIVQDGVLQRELRVNEIETFVFGEAGFAWKLRDLRAQLQVLRRDFQAHPTPELQRAIAGHRKLIASTLGMIERARAAEASGEATVFKAGCTPTFTYNTDASYSTDRQGTWADANAGFKVSSGCGASGEVYAYVYTNTIVEGITSTSTATDGPRSGLNVKAHAHAKHGGAGSPCESYAYASVTSNGLNPTSYSVSMTNDRCPAPSSCRTPVTCVDESPTATSDSVTVNKDSGASAIDVLANDVDPDGGPASIQSVTQPSNGMVVIIGGGELLTYRPNASYCNTPSGTTLDTFTYSLTPGGSTAIVMVAVNCIGDPTTTPRITVVPVDDPPVAVNDSAVVAEDSGSNAINVLANDTDPDGGPISITSATQPANGMVVITGGGTGLTYQPNPNYCNSVSGTPDTFTYTLTPGGSTATVSVTVTCVDDNPTAVADAATVAEDSAATAVPVLANDTDPDGGPISITSVTQPANGTVVITGGGTGLTYQPNANYCNNPPGTTLDTFTYALTPGGSTATVAVTVTCQDDNPTTVNDATTVNEGTSNNAIPVLANDTDPDAGPKSVQSVTQPANGTVTITGGGTGVAYTPNAGYCNNPPGTALDTFTYTLTPGGSSATVAMTVTCVDDRPTATADAATVTEDDPATPVDVLANDTDPDGGAKVIGSVTQPANGTVVITGGGTGLTYQPNENYCNTPPGTTLDTFTYTLTPGGSTAILSVTVICVDDNPTAVNDSATVNEDSGATAIPVLANDTDPDGGPISIASVTQPANGAVVITGGGTGLTYQPNAGYCNSVSGTPDTFTYTLTPGGSTATVPVTVTCMDDNPVAVADSATVAEDSGANAISVLANDTDADGGPISITSATQPANGAVVITGGGTGLTYQPNAGYCNSVSGTPDTFTYTLTPGGSTATVSVTVTCVDDNPVAVADSATVAEDSGANAISVLANDTDADGGPISITSVTQPANGTVVITGGGTGLTYAPNANYCNSMSGTPETFTYTLTPGGSTAMVSVTVVCINNPPVADNDTFDFIGNTDLVVDQAALSTPHTLATTPSTFGVLDGDSDPVENNAIAVTSITVGACTDASAPLDCTDPAVGRVQMQPNGRFIFTPAPGDTGATETFQYTVTDNGVPAPASTTATVTLTRFARVWYVKNNSPAGGLGRSSDPFDTLVEAETTSLAGDTIYVYFGDGTTAGHNAGIALKANQRLIGEGVQLSLPVSVNSGPSPTVLRAAGSQPLLDRTGGTGENVRVVNVTGIEIRGLNLSGIVNAIDIMTTAGGSAGAVIANNTIRGAGAEGIDVNAGGTGTMTLSIHDNTLTSAINVQGRNTSNVILTATNNDLNGVGGGSIRVGADDSSIVRATLSGNIIANTRAEGILATADKSAKLRLLVANNQITNTSSDGIKVANLDSDGGVGSELDAVITGNTVSGHNNNSGGNTSLAGIGVSSFGGPACVKVAGNNVQGTPSPGAAFFDYSLRELAGAMIFEESPNTKATVVTVDYILDGGSPDAIDTTPPNIGGSRTLNLVGTISLSNGALVCDRP